MQSKTKQNLSSSLTLKQNLLKVKKSIQKKFHDLHNDKLLLNERINEEYKPIIEPLKKIASSGENSNIAIKKERKTSINDKIDWKKIKKIEPKSLSFTRLSNSASTKKKGKIRRSYTPHDENKTIRNIDSGSNSFDDESFKSLAGTSSQMLSSTLNTNNNNNNSNHDASSDKNEADDESIERIGVITRNMKRIESQHNKKYYTANTSSERGGVYLGNDEVTFSQEFILIKGKRFKRTDGLLNLICSDNPTNYNLNDLQLYKEILHLTNAHRQNFMRRGQIVRDNSTKYNKIIKQIFPIDGRGGSKKLNTLQTKYMIVNKSGQIDYIYWDDPNELVERLRLLISSKSVGHTAHNNEIISIIEELYEADLIE